MLEGKKNRNIWFKLFTLGCCFLVLTQHCHCGFYRIKKKSHVLSHIHASLCSIYYLFQLQSTYCWFSCLCWILMWTVNGFILKQITETLVFCSLKCQHLVYICCCVKTGIWSIMILSTFSFHCLRLEIFSSLLKTLEYIYIFFSSLNAALLLFKLKSVLWAALFKWIKDK